MSTATPSGEYPKLDVDPFSFDFLCDPYPFHEQLREAGPLIWLQRYRVWAMARHSEVHAALSDWQTFSSSAGVGLSHFGKEKPWRPPSIILETDPPLHTRTRGVLMRILSRPALAQLQTTFQAEADSLIDKLIARGSFDAVTELAEPYPLKVFPDAVGLVSEDRDNLLPYGNMVFNAFGPRNPLFDEAMKHAEPVRAWMMAQCRREALRPDGFGAQVYGYVDKGELNEDEAGLLVRSLLSAGLDTTVYGLGNALHCFANFPDQWTLLRSDLSLVRAAFEEVIRYASPVQTFFRTTTKAVDLAGVRIGESEKVLLLLGAANRDPRKWEEPNRFNIQRKAAGHVGFGAGIHMCVGQAVARLEAETILTTLAKKVKAINLTGEAAWRLNNTLRGLDSLPISLIPA
ncbi:MAG: cytochrome P450 [Burkholderiales bacterium]